MFVKIKSAVAHALAKKIASLTGKSMTRIITQALEEKLARIEMTRDRVGLAEELNRIALSCASLPRRGRRSSDEIIGYDNCGLPR